MQRGISTETILMIRYPNLLVGSDLFSFHELLNLSRSTARLRWHLTTNKNPAQCCLRPRYNARLYWRHYMQINVNCSHLENSVETRSTTFILYLPEYFVSIYTDYSK